MKKTDKKDKKSPVESGGSCCCLGIAHKCSSSSSSSPSQPSLMTQKKYSIRSVVPIWTLESSLLVERSSDAMRCCLTSCLGFIRLLLHLRLLLSALTMHARVEKAKPHTICGRMGRCYMLCGGKRVPKRISSTLLLETLANSFF